MATSAFFEPKAKPEALLAARFASAPQSLVAGATTRCLSLSDLQREARLNAAIELVQGWLATQLSR